MTPSRRRTLPAVVLSRIVLADNALAGIAPRMQRAGQPRPRSFERKVFIRFGRGIGRIRP
jgi:hypothetical protein